MQLGIISRLFGSAMTPEAESEAPEVPKTDADTFAAMLSRLRGGRAGNGAAPGKTEPVDVGLIGAEPVEAELVAPELIGSELPDAALAGAEMAGSETMSPKQADAEARGAALTDTELPAESSHDVESRHDEPAGNEAIAAAYLLFSDAPPDTRAPETPQHTGESEQGDRVEPTTGAPPVLEMAAGTDETPATAHAEPSEPQRRSQAASSPATLRPENVSGDKELHVVRPYSDSPPQHVEESEGGTREVSAETAPASHGTADVPDNARARDTNTGSRPVSPGTYQPEHVDTDGIVSPDQFPTGSTLGQDQLETGSTLGQDQLETGSTTPTNHVVNARNEPVPSTARTDTNTGATSPQAIGKADGNITGEEKSNVQPRTSSPDTPATFNTDGSAGDSEREGRDASGYAEQDSTYPERAEYPSGIRPSEPGVAPAAPENMDTPAGVANDAVLDPPVLADALPEIKNQVDAAQDPKGQAPAADPSQPLIARPAAAAAWLRSMLAHHGQEMGSAGGWQVLNVKLDDAQGQVTVKARREEEKVSISVGFTDPTTRAMVQANAQRIEQTLEAQYQTSVDLSFFTGNEEQGAPGDNHQRGPETGSGKALAASDGHTPVAAHRPKPASALREWVV